MQRAMAGSGQQMMVMTEQGPMMIGAGGHDQIMGQPQMQVIQTASGPMYVHQQPVMMVQQQPQAGMQGQGSVAQGQPVQQAKKG